MDIAIQAEVFKQRPVLEEIYNQHGSVALFDYVSSWPVSSAAVDPIFSKLYERLLASVYGQALAAAALRQLSLKPLVSTIDHHGLWNHPIFVNADVIYSLYYKPEELVLVLSTESVSLNNTSSWSASVLFHDQVGKLTRHSLLLDRLKTLPVFSTPALTEAHIQQFDLRTHGQFRPLLEQVKFSEVVSMERFALQACKLSYNLWQAVFPSAPRLVYFPLETLVLEYLLALAENPTHPITQLVFTLKGQRVWQKYFGCEHTFLFWAIDFKGRRQPLTTLPKPEQLIQDLRAHKLYPSSPLCFVILLWAGITCVGGFTQTTWLTKTKQTLVELLTEMGESEHAAGIGLVPTKNFAESTLVEISKNGLNIAATGTDLCMLGADCYPSFVTRAKQLTVAQSIKAAMPTIYSVVVPKRG